MMVPSIRISMLSYSQITTFVLCKLRVSIAYTANCKVHTCCKFLKMTF